MFENIQSSKQNNSSEVLLNLLTSKDINLKTELTVKNIKELCRIKFISLILSKSTHEVKELAEGKEVIKLVEDTPFQRLDKVLEYYKELKSSLDRKRESAIVNGLKNIQESEDNKQSNLMDSMKK